MQTAHVFTPAPLATLGFSTTPAGHNRVALKVDGHIVAIDTAESIRRMLGLEPIEASPIEMLTKF